MEADANPNFEIRTVRDDVGIGLLKYKMHWSYADYLYSERNEKNLQNENH